MKQRSLPPVFWIAIAVSLSSPSLVKSLLSAMVQSPILLTPFPFQREMVSEVHLCIARGDRAILLCAGTGAGKTFMAAMLIQERLVERPSERVLFLVDLNALIPQTLQEFERLGLNCVVCQGRTGLQAGSKRQVAQSQVVIASCQTLVSRSRRKNFDELLGEGIGLIIADEAHNVAFSSIYSRLRGYYEDRGVIFIGLSATIKTQSAGDRFLALFYQKVIVSPSMPEMVRMGRCVPFKMMSPSGVLDIALLHIDEQTGDFDLEEQDSQIEAHYPQIVGAWQRYAQGRSTTAYCPTLDSAQGLVTEFLAAKIPAEIQTGSTPMGLDGLREHANDMTTRASQNYRLDTGVTKIICSVGTQVKGWNLPSLGCIIMLRATRSLQLALQIFGRGCRTCSNPYWNNGQPKADCILLDFGGNLERFAPISPNNYGTRKSDYDISLIPKEEDRFETSPGDRDLKGEQLEIEGEVESPETDPLELYEWFDSTAASQIKFLREQKKECFDRGCHPDEADRSFLQRFGFLPDRDWHQGAIFGAFPSEANRVSYVTYLSRYAPHDFWLEQKLLLEFGVGRDRPLRPSPSQPWHKVLGVSPRAKKAIAKKAFDRMYKQYSLAARHSTEAADALVVIQKAWNEANQRLIS